MSTSREEHRKQVAEYEHQLHAYEEQSRAIALQDKRDRNKAASARYYQKHPEVRVKKRIKMAEARAAKKLARRKWDPPKKTKVVKQPHVPETIIIDQELGGNSGTRIIDTELGDFPADLDLDLSWNPHDSYHLSHDELLEQFLETLKPRSSDSGSSEDLNYGLEVPQVLQTREAEAIDSLLQLGSQGIVSCPFPEDLPPSDEPGTSEDDESDSWAMLAPNYSSSEEELDDLII
ncbi:hypothetical protein C8R44DRAFT_892364 [Mycena epipterygia]|nr:hypothetical protein C8R44DRAFT_892364 [Mycena epipterygia]